MPKLCLVTLNMVHISLGNMKYGFDSIWHLLFYSVLYSVPPTHTYMSYAYIFEIAVLLFRTWSPTFLASGTDFMEDIFSTDRRVRLG